jgi:hypothetical protein
MGFTTTDSCIRTVRKGDKMWFIADKLVITPRAGFELSNDMPTGYREVISQAISLGYIKPVAYVKDSELMWEIMGNQND